MTETVVKIAVLAAVCTIAALIIRRGSSEMALVLSLAVCCAALYAAYSLASGAVGLIKSVSEMAQLSPAVTAPVLKCVGIGIVTRAAADICRDGGQGAIAGSVELVGAIGAVCTALPLAKTLLDMLEALL